MRKILTHCFLATVIIFSSSNLFAKNSYDPIKQLMQKTITEWHIPGMAVTIVKNDQIIWSDAVGYENMETQTKASRQSVWRMASISKPISALAIMQLVQTGKVNLDNPIQAYLPWYPVKKYPVTVRHLLTHTSGIRHYRDHEKENSQHFTDMKSAASIYHVDLEVLTFKPGTDYLYSSYAYALLAGIIEKVSGLTFAEYLKRNIFIPANMSGARLDQHDDVIPHRTSHYRWRNNKLINAPYIDASFKWSAGGILASTDDIARFAIALDKGLLVSTKALPQLYRPYKLTNGKSTGYGLGWHIENPPSGHLRAYHSGGATGGATFLLREPDKGVAIVIACNLEHPGPMKQLAETILEML